MGKTKKKQIVKEENPTKELKGICVVIGKMTPELAVAMLRKNPRCDDLDEGRIQRYAREMKAGRWMLNNTSIVYDHEYGVIDGRHRLWAVFEAGIPVYFVIAFVVA